MTTRISDKAVKSLTQGGWTMLSSSRASRTFRGGLTAIIKSDGHWSLSNARIELCHGLEPTIYEAAMEANNQAWDRPEYKEAQGT